MYKNAYGALFIVAENWKHHIIDHSFSSMFIYICAACIFLNGFCAFLHFIETYSMAKYAQPFMLGPTHLYSLISLFPASAPDILIRMLHGLPPPCLCTPCSCSLDVLPHVPLWHTSSAWKSPTYTSKPKSEITSFQKPSLNSHFTQPYPLKAELETSILISRNTLPFRSEFINQALLTFWVG